ncbi:hypothetical protein GNI_007900 [Gregarina niphandrodes]|uniref:Uncharacterized protein n=1 Tax=Gregarina niphandrodes TaxID=110365 RepID=A0A023BD49_GRENI|nr:hypothetical protein GNI_007900 [Gregarina niphandrodes]EZG87175.1 hypothetical protein GNI_007900 [Gregarina niphandrodes]|eukprot:XP_011128694.1 hypothetical protein GNI_007900 [Gregarina niphandrodes]
MKVVIALGSMLVSGETMMRYLLSDHVRPELTMSSALAQRMDQERLENLLAEARGGLVLVLPTDDGWQKFPALYNAINDDGVAANKFRADLMFAAGGEMDVVGGFDALLNYAYQNDGVVDTAYGTPIKVEEDARVCLAEYDSTWSLRTTKCAQLILPPLVFDDGSLYMTSDIILPDDLWNEINVYMADSAGSAQ